MNVDQDKWKKKFKFLFDREKLLNFDSQESKYLFSKKGIITKLEPVAVKQLGTEIMTQIMKPVIRSRFYAGLFKGPINSPLGIRLPIPVEKSKRRMKLTVFVLIP